MAVRKISSRACLESNATRNCSTDAQERTVSKLETLAKKLGVPLRFGTLVGKYPQTIILDYKYQDSAVSVSSNGSFEINGEEFGSYDSYFSFSRVNIDDVKNALLSLKEEAGEEESLTESDDVWSTPESAAKSLFDRGLVASDYVERACKRHGKDNNFAHEVGVIISQMIEEDEESLKEGNPVSSKLPASLDSFLQDIAQIHGGISYNDIMKFNPDESQIKELKKLRAKYRREAQYDDEESEKTLASISKEVANIVKSESLTETTDSKDVYLDSQTRYELEQVLDYLENSAGAFKKILSRNRWNETATDSLVDDMKDCFNRVKKIAYSLDSDRYSMFDGR